MPKTFNGFTITEDQQVSGASMMSLVEGIGKINPRFMEVYQKYNLNNIKADEWYPMIEWLSALHDINAMRGGKLAIRQVAKLIPVHAKYPPEITSLPTGLDQLEAVVNGWDMIYKMNQTGEVGGYEVRDLKSSSVKKNWVITECVPFPPDIGLGVGQGFCERFLDRSQYNFKVYHNVGNTGLRDGKHTTEIWMTVEAVNAE